MKSPLFPALAAALAAGGVIRPERLCRPPHHDFHLEPNASFNPDGKYVVFRSDRLKDTYAFAVEVAQASP